MMLHSLLKKVYGITFSGIILCMPLYGMEKAKATEVSCPAYAVHIKAAFDEVEKGELKKTQITDDEITYSYTIGSKYYGTKSSCQLVVSRKDEHARLLMEIFFGDGTIERILKEHLKIITEPTMSIVGEPVIDEKNFYHQENRINEFGEKIKKELIFYLRFMCLKHSTGYDASCGAGMKPTLNTKDYKSYLFLSYSLFFENNVPRVRLLYTDREPSKYLKELNDLFMAVAMPEDQELYGEIFELIKPFFGDTVSHKMDDESLKNVKNATKLLYKIGSYPCYYEPASELALKVAKGNYLKFVDESTYGTKKISKDKRHKGSRRTCKVLKSLVRKFPKYGDEIFDFIQNEVPWQRRSSFKDCLWLIGKSGNEKALSYLFDQGKEHNDEFLCILLRNGLRVDEVAAILKERLTNNLNYWSPSYEYDMSITDLVKLLKLFIDTKRYEIFDIWVKYIKKALLPNPNFRNGSRPYEPLAELVLTEKLRKKVQERVEAKDEAIYDGAFKLFCVAIECYVKADWEMGNCGLGGSSMRSLKTLVENGYKPQFPKGLLKSILERRKDLACVAPYFLELLLELIKKDVAPDEVYDVIEETCKVLKEIVAEHDTCSEEKLDQEEYLKLVYQYVSFSANKRGGPKKFDEWLPKHLLSLSRITWDKKNEAQYKVLEQKILSQISKPDKVLHQ